MLAARDQWESGRDRAMHQWEQRFLYNNEDPLGPLPDGWERRDDPNTGRRFYYFNLKYLHLCN
jgi:hypothetical protein